jgi:subtilisin family serine protease
MAAMVGVRLAVVLMFLVAATGSPVRSTVYIVHMAHNVSHNDVMAKGAWYTELMQGAKDVHPDGTEGSKCMHHVYEKVFNGFSARMTPKQAEYMKRVPGVLAVYPNRMHKASTTHTPEFLGLTATTARLWNESRLGEDVIIGVIDSGIWPERASFSDVNMGPIPARWKGGCDPGVAFNVSLCNNKLIGARYFYLGNEADYGPINDTVEYLSARDWNGHGTHCASTAAGRMVAPAFAYDNLAPGTAAGMAPKARIAVYKALWRDAGQGATDDIVAAIDKAVIDGVDIISFSVSGFSTGSPLSDDPFAIAAYNAMKQGIFFSAAAGNDGPEVFTIHHSAPWVTTVGATTQDRAIDSSVELGDGKLLSGRSVFDGRGANGNDSYPLIYAGDAAISTTDPFNASICLSSEYLNPTLIAGKLVLCDAHPDASPFDIVVNGGAAGLILANTLPGDEGLQLPGSTGAIPVTLVGTAARTAILAYYIAAAAPIARVLPAKTVLGVKPAPMVAKFSARGPLAVSSDGQWMKPDIAAPGVDILAAGIRNEQFAFMSGTSMACPHISGLAALLKSVHPNWSPAAIKSALMTTATTQDNTGKTITAAERSNTASPWEFGSGLTLPELAINPGLVYDMGPQDYFHFLCALSYTTEQIAVYEPMPFTCPPQQRIEDLNLPSFVAVFPLANKTPITFQRFLTSVSSGIATYTATVVPPEGFAVTVDPPTLSFSPTERIQRFVLTVTSVNAAVAAPAFSVGTIAWSDGVHVVRSPVMAYDILQ